MAFGLLGILVKKIKHLKKNKILHVLKANVNMIMSDNKITIF